MTTHSKQDVSIDLFNLPPLPDSNKWNTMDAYLDVPNNYYIPDGKNSWLLDWVERREFMRKRPQMVMKGLYFKFLSWSVPFGTK